MSFFGYLAAGAGEGLGKGLVSEADYQERLDRERQLLQEKQAAELQRQRERLDDQAALKLTLAGMKEGSAGGKGEFNLYREMVNADTPEKQDRLIALQRAVGGDPNGSDALAEAYGRGRSNIVNRTVSDFDPNTGDTLEPTPVSYSQKAQYDAQKGAIALQRVMAVAMDPSKLKNYAEGEAQILRNDVAANVTLPDALKEGERDPEAMNQALSPLNPKAGLDEAKNSLAAERIQQAREAEAGRAARAGDSLGARGRDLLIKERKGLVDATSGAKGILLEPNELAAAKERIAEIDDQLSSAPVVRPATVAPRAPASAPAKPRTPAQAAAAYKAGQRY